MKLLDSLLDAIVRLEGDALVMHVGEKPYVVTASASLNEYRGPLVWGHVELSSRVLTYDAMASMLAQILTPEQQQALNELGAIEHEIPATETHERFTIVAARGGEDVWVEVRRRPLRVPEPEPQVETPPLIDVVEPGVAEPDAVDAVAAAPPEDLAEAEAEPEPVVEEVPATSTAAAAFAGEAQSTPTEAEVDAMLAATAAALLTSGLGTGVSDVTIADEEAMADRTYVETNERVLVGVGGGGYDVSDPAFELSPPTLADFLEDPEREPVAPPDNRAPDTPLFSEDAMLAAAGTDADDEPPPLPPADESEEAAHATLTSKLSSWASALTGWATGAPSTESEPEPTRVPPEPESLPTLNTLPAVPEPAESEPAPHIWVPPSAEMPMDRTSESRYATPVAEIDQPPAPVAAETHDADAGHRSPYDEDQRVGASGGSDDGASEAASTPFRPADDAALTRTLRAAADRGASTVYVVAQSKPMVRVDGEISALEGEPVLAAADVERLVLELVPPRRREALQNGPVEWLCDVPEIGRVRCLTFKDHRGPGVLFRMFPQRAISADQLALSPEVQALCQQSDGLVLVAGGRASGKSTLLNAFVDLINRTRSDHIVTVESQIGFVHESRRSFISQRETRGDGTLAATFVRSALHEDPDVIMIEDLKSAEIVAAAIDAAASGRLVLASISAASTVGALERLLEVLPADRRAKARTSLSTSLRGVISQVLLRRASGGRVAAREILLNTPAVSAIVEEGKLFQLPAALDSGRRLGMQPLTDSLAGHVREGTVQVDEAYRKALDRAALVTHLKREGVDTSFAERLA